MLYALTHPTRTVRWWRYRLAHALRERRQALAALRSRRCARRPLATASCDGEVHMPDRGEVVGRAFIGREGEVRHLDIDAGRSDPLDARPLLIPRDADGRHVW